MGIDILIGNGIAKCNKDNFPYLSSSYSYFDSLLKNCNIKMYWREKIPGQVEGCVGLTHYDLDIFKSIDQSKLDEDEKKDVEWFIFMIDWALNNCEIPAIYVF